MPFATNGAVEIYYEVMGGSADDPTMLLINGLGSQCIKYHEDWCAMLVAEGLRVVRFDNRDVGLSTHFGDQSSGDDGAWYTISDMVADAVAVLDAVNADKAHIVGFSMGGMIAQMLAIESPDRVATLCSVMSATGERGHVHRSPKRSPSSPLRHRPTSTRTSKTGPAGCASGAARSSPTRNAGVKKPSGPTNGASTRRARHGRPQRS